MFPVSARLRLAAALTVAAITSALVLVSPAPARQAAPTDAERPVSGQFQFDQSQPCAGSTPVQRASDSTRQPAQQDLISFRDQVGVRRETDEKVLTQYEPGFQAELHQALPNADASTLKKAINLESDLGRLVASMQYVQQMVQHYIYSGKRYASAAEAKKYAQANQRHLAFNAARQAQIKPLLSEEAHIFPDTAQARQHLAQVHMFAIKAHNRAFNVTVDSAESDSLDSVVRSK